MATTFNFVQKCDELVRERKKTSLTSQSLWDDYLSHGVGNNVVAGEHEDRDVLELLQNARDAIAGRKGTTGNILIAITDQGMVIANTGAPFDLENEKVFQAITLLGESSKATDRQMVGHKGIGMKSILQRFGKFSIHTHLGENTELTAEFSRALTYDKLKPEIEKSPFKEYIWSHLPKLPLFRTPHHKTSPDTLLDSVRKGGEKGLTPSTLFDINAYTTSLSLYFRDNDWEKILDTVKGSLADENAGEFHRARENFQITASVDHPQAYLWNLLTDPDKLDPRTFILLGHISQIQMVNFHRTPNNSLEPAEVKTYRILQSPISPDTSARTVKLLESFWKKDTGTSETERMFLTFSRSFEEAQNEYVQLLFEKPRENLAIADQPLYLYYPIQTAKSGLPFVIHGPFLVTPSRKELSNNSFAQVKNRNVLKVAIDILQTSLPTFLSEPEWRDWMPWLILPLGKLPDHPAMNGLNQSVIALIKESACVPSLNNQTFLKPSEAYFIPERPKAFMLWDTWGNTGDFPFMAKANRDRYERYQDVLQNAARNVGFGSFSTDVMIGQIQIPQTELNAEAAREYFAAICYLLSQAGDKGRELAKTIGEKQLPLFPIYTQQHEKAILVPALARGKSDDRQNLRVVFRITQKIENLPIPPHGVDIYFVITDDFTRDDKTTIELALKDYSIEWDVSEYQGYPDLFKRVAERLDEIGENDRAVIAPTLGYLAGLLSKINPGKDDVLFPRPYASVDVERLEQYLDRDEKNNALEELTRMQNWRHKVWVPANADAQLLVKDAAFGPAWASLLESMPGTTANTELTRWANAIRALEQYRKAVPDGCVEIADPTSLAWNLTYEQIRQNYLLDEKECQFALFRLLLLMGVRIGPRVEWRWLSKSGKGQDAMPKLGFRTQQNKTNLPEGLRLNLVQNYAELLEAYYPPGQYIKITGQGSAGFLDTNTCSIYAWIWFTDLESAAQNAPDLFTVCLEYLWEDVENLLNTGWFIGDGSRWAPAPVKRIPSFAQFQLMTLPIWSGRIQAKPERDGFYPWLCFLSLDESQKIHLASRFFPMREIQMDENQNQQYRGLRGIEHPKRESIEALYKLHWLLCAIRQEDSDYRSQWRIDPIDQDGMQSVCYTLLKKINAGNLPLTQYGWPGLVIPAVKDGQWYAIPLSDKEAVSRLSFFEHPPYPWERDKIKDSLLIMTNQGALDPELRSWIKYITENKATQIEEPIPDFDGTHIDAPETNNLLRELSNRRLLLEGTIKSVLGEEKAGVAKQRLAEIIEKKQVKAVTDKDEWAYKDTAGNLIYIVKDYINRKTAVIAFGLAKELGMTGSSIASLTLALTAESNVVEWELKRQGIELTSHLELVQEKLQFLLTALLGIYEQKFSLTQVELSAYETFCKSPESGLPTGGFTNSLQSIFQPEYIRQFLGLACENDSQSINLGFVQQILGILRNANWNTSHCKQVLDRIDGAAPIEAELNRLYSSAKAMFELARFIVMSADKPEPDDDDEQLNKARILKFGLFDSPGDLGLYFLAPAVGQQLFIEQGVLEICSEHLHRYFEQQKQTHAGDWPSIMLECLEKESLQPLFQQGKRVDTPEMFDQKRNLDSRFYRAEQTFTIPDFAMMANKPSDLVAAHSQSVNFGDPGAGRNHNLPKVTLRQGLRGRIAELYVLEVCWQNFLKVDATVRKEVMEALKAYYNAHPRYKDYWQAVFQNFDQHQQAILNGQDKESFCKLLDLTGFGLAGFDIVVPQRLWPVEGVATAKHDIYCVEVKSVYADTPQIDGAEIILTTHEYRVATQNPAYPHLLRLIVVPPDSENYQNGNYSGVTFVKDVDLAALENMKDVLFASVRGGHFPLRLSWGTEPKE